MSWFEDDPNRLLEERTAVAELQQSSPWLTTVEWMIDEEGRLCAAFTIDFAGEIKSATMRYPNIFPFGPPGVFPQNEESWSSHQYLNGELCLERGPDNWTPETTGAEMIASTHRLLCFEVLKDVGIPMPSRHHLTVGQAARSSLARFVCTADLWNLLSRVPAGQTMGLEVLVRSRALPGDRTSRIALPIRATLGAREAAFAVPGAFLTGTKFKADVFGCPEDPSTLSFETGTELKSAIAALGYKATENEPDAVEGILLLHGETIRLVIITDSDNLIEFATLREDETSRSAIPSERLGQKVVTVVGGGSLGSKVAASLARSGIMYFCLIDDDLLMPENMRRHELDWSGVGEHKVNALRRRLKLISPDANVVLRPGRLGGQESGSYFAGLVGEIAKSDLVVDATANGEVFNHLAAIVAANNIPLVWGEVYPGGIGGLIARSRPGLDPSPQGARKRILSACDGFGKPAPKAAKRYETDDEAGPMVAEDCDVGVVAAHLTGFALDILAESDRSKYPASAYLIGLSEGWEFTQPFDTRPIPLGEPEAELERASATPEAAEGLRQLLEARSGADSVAP